MGYYSHVVRAIKSAIPRPRFKHRRDPESRPRNVTDVDLSLGPSRWWQWVKPILSRSFAS